MPVAATVESSDLDRRGMAVLSASHMFTDVSQGALPALLPFFVQQRGWSYAAVAALVLAHTVASSVMQPLFGIASDRYGLSALIPVGVLLSGLGIAVSGVAPSYEWTFAAMVVSGSGVAAFHPEGSRYANYVSGSRRGRGMSLFAVGGNAGFATGPLLATPLVLAFGLPGTVWLAVPTTLMALVAARELPRLRTFKPSAPKRASADASGENDVGAFVRLGGVITLRSFFYFGFSTFLPLYFIQELGTSTAEANIALSVLLVSGAVGTLIGGPLADRYGRRTVLLTTYGVTTPLMLAFLASGQIVATGLLAFIGAAIIATFSLTVLMGQEYMPDRIGLASGVTLGLAIGLGGVGASLFGVVADLYGLRVTMEVLAALPLLAAALALTLPRHTVRERRDLAARAA